MTRTFSQTPPVTAFVVFGALPGLLLVAGALIGGWPLWAGLIWAAVAAPAVDVALSRAFPDADAQAHFPAADAGLVLLIGLHFALLAVALAAFAGDWLTRTERVALFLGAGMYFGQITNATAHELIHRPSRTLFRLGAAAYVSLLFGHHTSAHRLVHHHHVATDADPNSAPQGMGFWRFFPRAWIGSFRQGLRAERALSARKPGRLNPYLAWVGGGLAMIAGVGLILGGLALADYLALCLYAQMQLMLSDYVQHYGLRRRTGPDGKPEPVGPRHSWDSPHALSSLTLVNAPRHSDHHAHPLRAYPALRLARAEAPRPMLPYPLSVMGAIALVPPLWRRVMDRRVARMATSDKA
ncbi:alkane 1-monooxygenase [Paracoccus sp. M683]|uniref:alkane 1-monooxygenase n=1 Tax=Paracoccus sp. M683 TaxID=2594268 RepID=UPI00117ED91B|nr:alkane 1-monooxygenase [Paracoccus sp. M683]TRW96807.1 alkane 1-monooxygenase [Paracoccus sp. M683]